MSKPVTEAAVAGANKETRDADGPEKACRSFMRAFIVEIVLVHFPLFIKACEGPEGLLVAVPSLLVHLVAYGFAEALFDTLCAIWKELRRTDRRGIDRQ